MKIDLHSKPENRERLIIPVSEFSFAAYPIVINASFPLCFPSGECARHAGQTARARMVSANFTLAPARVRHGSGSAGKTNDFRPNLGIEITTHN